MDAGTREGQTGGGQLVSLLIPFHPFVGQMLSLRDLVGLRASKLWCCSIAVSFANFCWERRLDNLGSWLFAIPLRHGCQLIAAT